MGELDIDRTYQIGSIRLLLTQTTSKASRPALESSLDTDEIDGALGLNILSDWL